MKILFLLFLAVNLSACATIGKWHRSLYFPDKEELENLLPPPEVMERARKNFQTNHCNYEGAFEWGSNEARNRQPMNGNYLSSHCPLESRQAVMRGYREGYFSVTNYSKTPSVIVISPQRE